VPLSRHIANSDKKCIDFVFAAKAAGRHIVGQIKRLKAFY